MCGTISANREKRWGPGGTKKNMSARGEREYRRVEERA